MSDEKNDVQEGMVKQEPSPEADPGLQGGAQEPPGSEPGPGANEGTAPVNAGTDPDPLGPPPDSASGGPIQDTDKEPEVEGGVVSEDPPPTPSEAFAIGKQYFAGPEWDLAVMREANAIRGNPERFKAVRALPGGANIH